MNKYHLKAASEMLERYSSQLSRHSCNDADLADYGFPREEWEAFDKLAEEVNRTPHEHTPGNPPTFYRERQPDFMVATVLSTVLARAAEEMP